MAELPLLYQHSTRWVYSVSVDIQGYVVEMPSGRSLPEFMAERIAAISDPALAEGVRHGAAGGRGKSERIDRLSADVSLTAVAHQYQTLEAEHVLRQARSRDMLIKLAPLPCPRGQRKLRK